MNIRKKIYNKAISLMLVFMMLFSLTPSTVLASSNNKSNQVIEVPDDFENDLWLQYDFKEMKVGDSAQIYPRRIQQIISNAMANDVHRPNFNFEIVSGDSVELSTLKSDDRTEVKAVKAGTTIVKVSYDETTYKGKTYGACSKVNEAYVVYSVTDKEDSSISITTDIKESSYDTIYYTEESGVDFDFKVDTTNADDVKVTVNGEEIKSKNNNYTAKLKNRSNIIGVEATNSKGETKSYYKVVDARRIEINIENKTNPGEKISVGDTAVISFKGISNPIAKLASIYNPTYYDEVWGNKCTFVEYENDTFGTLKGYCNQWDLATKNSFEVTFDEEGTYTFSNGRIFTQWWGAILGEDKKIDNKGIPNTGSGTHEGYFSSLPEFKIKVGNNNDDNNNGDDNNNEELPDNNNGDDNDNDDNNNEELPPAESNTPPVITANDVELYVGDTFNPMENVTAYDEEDKDITSKIEIVKNTVDTSKADVYKVVYKVVDNDNNEVTQEIKVTVKEKAPTPQEQFIKIGVYTDEGTIYESLEVEYKENDTAYTVLKRLLGDKVIASGENETLYVSSIDGLAEMDKGPHSGWVYSVNRVTPEVSAGAYKLSPNDELIWHYTLNLGKDITNSYEKFDEFKNKHDNEDKEDSESTQPPVEENEAPVINAKDIEIKVGDTFDPMKNVIATDKEDKDLTSKIKVIKNTVDTSKAGSYEVIYEVTDSQGLTTTKSITVTVTEKVNKFDVSEVKSNTANWILSNLKNPGYGDEWKIFALARGNINVQPLARGNINNLYETYYNNLVNTLKEKNGVLHRAKYTEYSRVIITLTALGYDPTDVGGYNLVEKLYNYDNVSKQGLNGVIFALIALDSNNFEIKGNENSREMLINGILSKQLADGGFNLSGTTGDVDVTAMAIQALAKYKNQPDVKSALDKAIDFLSKSQLSTGGFGTSEGETAESNAQVLIALSTLGIDVNDTRFIKDGNSIIDAIMRFKVENGGFKHLLSQTDANNMATEQVLLALVSLERASNGKTSLYDMSDVELRNPEDDGGKPEDDGRKPGADGEKPVDDGRKPGADGEKPDNTENNSPKTSDKSIVPFVICATLAMGTLVLLNRRKLD